LKNRLEKGFGMFEFQVSPTNPLKGEISVPGDKSISHRSIMLASIANGVSEITGFLWGEDNLATLKAFQQMGVNIEVDKQSDKIRLHGVGLQGLKKASEPLDLGNSGTAMRLLTGLLAGQAFNSALIGDESLSQRPMIRVVKPLREMGADIQLSADGTAPIHILGSQKLKGIEYTLPVASAQVKSAILLAGLYAKGETTVIESGVTRDHTERLLQAFQYPIKTNVNRFSVSGPHELTATSFSIPGDISSAAFFLVAASITPGSHILLKNVGVNSTRIGIINVLKMMGAELQLHNQRESANETVADIEVRSAKLHGIDIPEDQVPLAIDEMPVLMIAAACATGITRLRAAGELRVKETDRITAMAVGLKTLGIVCEPKPDGIIIEGGKFQWGTVNSFGDHRIAMAFAVAGCVAMGDVSIQDCENVKTSFPNFVACAKALGFQIEEKNG
jgi:3-phosphoshikimate 1-carboxyvinyltransferase